MSHDTQHDAPLKHNRRQPVNQFPFTHDTHPDLTAAIRAVVHESHTKAQLERMSVGQLRVLLKKNEGKAGKAGIPKGDTARELADIRGLLRSKGAGGVLDEASPCERAALARLKAANAEDLKEKPGKAGEAAHKRLHKTLKGVLGESATKAALEDWMYSIPPAAVEALRPVMRIKSITKRFAAINKTLKAHGFTTRFMGSMPADVVNSYFDTYFGQ
jgi:hypothetical protein